MNYISEIQAITDLVAEKLSDESLIVPVDERACFNSIINFLKKISPLASGVYNIGNVVNDELRTIALPYDVGTSDYRVEGSLVSNGSNFNNDNDVCEMIKDKGTASFKLCLREFTGNNQDIYFEWAIYPKNS